MLFFKGKKLEMEKLKKKKKTGDFVVGEGGSRKESGNGRNHEPNHECSDNKLEIDVNLLALSVPQTIVHSPYRW